MKQRRFIITIIILLTSLTSFQQTGIIKGQVFDIRENKGHAFARICLNNTKIMTTADIKGNFIIDSISPGTYELKISDIYGDTTLKNIIITADKTVTIKINWTRQCIYDKHKKNKTCPICGKKDQVVPIEYGIPIGQLDEKKYYYAGCKVTYCVPNWYCKRDKHKF